MSSGTQKLGLKDAAVEKPVDDGSDIRPEEESVLPCKALIVDLFRGFEVVFHALLGGRGLRFSGAVGIGVRERKLGLPVDGLVLQAQDSSPLSLQR